MDQLLQFYIENQIIAIYLAIINLITFGLYFIDKLKAQSNAWRIRERTLLLLALAGGSIGAIIAMKLFRHKTKKDSFLLWFFLILTIQVIALIYLPTAVDYLVSLDTTF